MALTSESLEEQASLRSNLLTVVSSIFPFWTRLRLWQVRNTKLKMGRLIFTELRAKYAGGLKELEAGLERAREKIAD